MLKGSYRILVKRLARKALYRLERADQALTKYNDTIVELHRLGYHQVPLAVAIEGWCFSDEGVMCTVSSEALTKLEDQPPLPLSEYWADPRGKSTREDTVVTS